MLWLLIPVVVLISILVYVLFAPFYIEVDSEKGVCGMRFHRLAAARVRVGDSIFIDLRIAWWHKYIDLLSAGKKKSSVVQEKAKRSRRKRRNGKKMSFRKMLALVRTFRVRTCVLHLDTGDNPLNGILFPCFLLIGYVTGRNIEINFRDENILKLEIQNNMARMMWVFLTK